MKVKIGIIGCGAIGSSLAEAVGGDLSAQAEISALFDTQMQKAYSLASRLNNPKLVALDLDNLLRKVNLAVEATRLGDAFEIAKKAISAGCDILIMSAGGILEHYAEIEALAAEKGVKVYIPSGAIAGIDGLKAAKCAKINQVTLTTKKPPQAFIGSPYVLKRKIQLDKIEKDTVIFEGDAFTATRAFPQNINVAATLSLAGLGPAKTTVRIIASPGLKQNVHEIEIESDSGRIISRCENLIHPQNPKTSYLAVLSAIAVLRGILTPLKIGT
jgi:aspartate dehydrogenase